MAKLIFLLSFLIFTVSTFSQSQKEKLKVFWPEEYNWKTIVNTDDSTTSFVQVIPEKENSNNWSIAGTIKTTKNLVAPNLNLIIQSYTNAALKESSKSKVTVIEKNDSKKIFE